MKKILVVDDEVDIATILQASLQRMEGVSVSIAHSGQQALAMTADTKFDLIILDFMMPGMDGPAVLKALREQCGNDLRVAFLTARAMKSDREALMALDVLDVLIKPFNPLELNEKVAALL